MRWLDVFWLPRGYLARSVEILVFTADALWTLLPSWTLKRNDLGVLSQRVSGGSCEKHLLQVDLEEVDKLYGMCWQVDCGVLFYFVSLIVCLFLLSFVCGFFFLLEVRKICVGVVIRNKTIKTTENQSSVPVPEPTLSYRSLSNCF